MITIKEQPPQAPGVLMTTDEIESFAGAIIDGYIGHIRRGDVGDALVSIAGDMNRIREGGANPGLIQAFLKLQAIGFIPATTDLYTFVGEFPSEAAVIEYVQSKVAVATERIPQINTSSTHGK